MAGRFTARHREAGLMALALVEARLRGDDEAVRVLVDPALYDLVVPALVELLAQTLQFRLSERSQGRQLEVWRASLLRRPVDEEE